MCRKTSIGASKRLNHEIVVQDKVLLGRKGRSPAPTKLYQRRKKNLFFQVVKISNASVWICWRWPINIWLHLKRFLLIWDRLDAAQVAAAAAAANSARAAASLPIHRKIIEMPQHEAFVFVLLFSSDSSDIGCCTLGLKRQVWWDSSQPCCQKHCSTMTTRLFENNIWHISIPAPFLNLQIACLSLSSLAMAL